MKDLQNLLFTMQDIKYKEFSSKLIPNISKECIIGVRVPKLRKLAKNYFNNENTNEFLLQLPHMYHEENFIHAFLLQEIKDFDTAIKYIEDFLPFIDNWAICDCFVPKAFVNNTDKLFFYIKNWIKSSHFYTVRYAVCLLMKLYLDEKFDKIHLKMVSKIKSDDYYVNMVRAWYFATALAKQYDCAIEYIKNKTLDVWTHNKTIQKAKESYRIDIEIKNYICSMRINKNKN